MTKYLWCISIPVLNEVFVGDFGSHGRCISGRAPPFVRGTRRHFGRMWPEGAILFVVLRRTLARLLYECQRARPCLHDQHYWTGPGPSQQNAYVPFHYKNSEYNILFFTLEARHFLTRALLSARNLIEAQATLRDKGTGSAHGFCVNMAFTKQVSLLIVKKWLEKPKNNIQTIVRRDHFCFIALKLDQQMRITNLSCPFWLFRREKVTLIAISMLTIQTFVVISEC